MVLNYEIAILPNADRSGAGVPLYRAAFRGPETPRPARAAHPQVATILQDASVALES